MKIDNVENITHHPLSDGCKISSIETKIELQRVELIMQEKPSSVPSKKIPVQKSKLSTLSTVSQEARSTLSKNLQKCKKEFSLKRQKLPHTLIQDHSDKKGIQEVREEEKKVASLQVLSEVNEESSVDPKAHFQLIQQKIQKNLFPDAKIIQSTSSESLQKCKKELSMKRQKLPHTLLQDPSEKKGIEGIREGEKKVVSLQVLSEVNEESSVDPKANFQLIQQKIQKNLFPNAKITQANNLKSPIASQKVQSISSENLQKCKKELSLKNQTLPIQDHAQEKEVGSKKDEDLFAFNEHTKEMLRKDIDNVMRRDKNYKIIEEYQDVLKKIGTKNQISLGSNNQIITKKSFALFRALFSRWIGTSSQSRAAIKNFINKYQEVIELARGLKVPLDSDESANEVNNDLDNIINQVTSDFYNLTITNSWLGLALKNNRDLLKESSVVLFDVKNGARTDSDNLKIGFYELIITNESMQTVLRKNTHLLKSVYKTLIDIQNQTNCDVSSIKRKIKELIIDNSSIRAALQKNAALLTEWCVTLLNLKET